MPTTSNFGWTTPADTDLVKDGAAAIRTLGNGIDTSFLDLKGGTTGQVLSKASNTDLDFSWVAQDDSNAIQNAIVDAKGDLISATAADTPARLAVGANGTVLTADSAEATGLKWAAPAAGGFVGCSLYDSNATQSIATGTDTVVTFNSEFFDTDGFHSTSTNTGRITIPSGKGGKYLFIASALFSNLASGKEARFYKNGSQLLTYGWTSASGVAGTSISAIIDLVATDYIEFRVVQGSGGNADLYKSGGGAGEYAYFQCQYLGA